MIQLALLVCPTYGKKKLKLQRAKKNEQFIGTLQKVIYLFLLSFCKSSWVYLAVNSKRLLPRSLPLLLLLRGTALWMRSKLPHTNKSHTRTLACQKWRGQTRKTSSNLFFVLFLPCFGFVLLFSFSLSLFCIRLLCLSLAGSDASHPRRDDGFDRQRWPHWRLVLPFVKASINISLYGGSYGSPSITVATHERDISPLQELPLQHWKHPVRNRRPGKTYLSKMEAIGSLVSVSITVTISKNTHELRRKRHLASPSATITMPKTPGQE